MVQYRALHAKVIQSFDFNEMPDDFTRLTWLLLPLGVDCEGRGIFNAAWVKAKLFTLRDDVPSERVLAALDWFASRGMIAIYSVDGRQYFYLTNFKTYQRGLDKEAKSVLPPPVQLNASEERAPAPVQLSSSEERVPPPPEEREPGLSEEEAADKSDAAALEQSPPQAQPPAPHAPAPSTEAPAALPPRSGAAPELRAPSARLKADTDPETEAQPSTDADADAAGETSADGDRAIAEFCRVSGITWKPKGEQQRTQWLRALQELERAGADAATLRQACRECAEKGYNITGPGSLLKPVQLILNRSRLRSREREPDYLGQFGEFVHH